MHPNTLQLVAFVTAALILIISLVMMAQFFSLWIQALAAGARVTLVELMSMRLRKVDPKRIVFTRIRTVKPGLSLSVAQLEAHHQAGGRVDAVVNALIAATGSGST